MMSSDGFVIDASRDDSTSGSESEFDVPQFKLTAFHKYNLPKSGNSENKESCLKNRESERNGVYVNVYPDGQDVQSRIALQKKTLQNCIKEVEKKSVAKPGFETLECVPTFLSRRQNRKLGMKSKAKTKGFGWYNMQAPEMTDEMKNDLTVVQMRKALDPKHFYKRSALKKDSNPKYFEVGTYEESPLDFYCSRLPKKQRKKTLVEELMADAEFHSYQKRKMSEILKSRPKTFRQKNVKRKKEKKSSTTSKKGIVKEPAL